MTAFDPGAVPPADEFDADPAEVELQQWLKAARALIDGLRPATAANVERFLEDDALESAALVREHDRPYFWRLTEELRPFKILRQWQDALGAVAKQMAEVEQKIAEKVRLVALGVELLELWHDGSDAWSWPKEHGPGCCWRVPGSEVRRYLLRAYGERHQMTLEDGQKVPMAPSRQAVGEALDQLEAVAYGAERRPEPSLRVAGDGAWVVLDLCRDDYSVVEITAAGWEVVKPAPLAMRRAEGMLPLPLPAQGAGDALGDLRELLGFGGAEHADAWALVVGFAFACLSPAAPYPVLVIGAEQGSGKTTLGRVIRAVVDPHKVREQPKPRSEDDLFVAADGQWLAIYDNLSSLDQHWSDAFCRIATGSGYSKRKLYSDRDVAQFRVARPQVITSIVDVAAAPDLLDRSLLLQLPQIGERRRSEVELLADVAALAPRVLGQLLDAAALALRDRSKITLSQTPRLVDVGRWVEAGAPALGLEPEQFLAAYLDSQVSAGALALETSVVGGPLKAMLDLRDICAAGNIVEPDEDLHPGPMGFVGTATQLLAELTAFMRNTDRKLPRHWPETPRAMSGALRRIAPPLRRLGYRVTIERQGRANDRHTVMEIETPAQLRQSHNQNKKRCSPNDPHDPHRPHSQPVGGDRGDGGDRAQRHKKEGGNREKANGPACDQPGCAHPACSTGPDGSWCGDHLEPWQRRQGLHKTGGLP